MREINGDTQRERLFPVRAGLVVVAVCTVFWPVLGFEFVWDDKNLILLNPYLRQTDALFAAFRMDFWELTNNPHFAGMYRPLIFVSYWVDYHLFGANPTGFHAVNLLIHIVVCSLAFPLGMRMGLTRRSALVAALIFAVHPLQAEAVANVASRTDLVATMLLFGGLLLFLKQTARCKLLGVALMFLSLLAKESTIVGPILAIAIQHYSGAEKRRTSLISLSPLAVYILYFPLRLSALGLETGSSFLADGPWMGGYVLVRYLLRFVLPLPQPPVADIAYPGVVVVLASCALLLTMAALLFALRAPSWLRLCAVWIGLGFLPVSEIVPLGVRFSDLLCYLPLFGFALLLGRLTEIKRVYFSAALALVVALAAICHLRVWIWENNLTLWRVGVDLNPDNPLMTMNLANAMIESGEAESGCNLMGRAIELAAMRSSPEIESRARYNMGNCYLNIGGWEKALLNYEAAINLSKGQIHQALFNKALALGQLGRSSEALATAKRLAEIKPDLASTWELLAEIHFKQQNWPESVSAYERALDISPGDANIERRLKEAKDRSDQAGSH